MFKVEKNIPIPPTVTVYGRRSRFPLSELNSGDSFMVPFTDSSPEAIKKSLLGAIRNYRSRHGKNIYFATRVYKTGIRCWRI